MNITITGAKIYILSIVLLISSHMFSTIDTVGRQNELFGQRLLETPPPPSSGETNTDPNTSSGTDPNTSSGTDPNTSTSSGTDTSNSDYKPPPPMDDVSQTQNQTNITRKKKKTRSVSKLGISRPRFRRMTICTLKWSQRETLTTKATRRLKSKRIPVSLNRRRYMSRPRSVKSIA